MKRLFGYFNSAKIKLGNTYFKIINVVNKSFNVVSLQTAHVGHILTSQVAVLPSPEQVSSSEQGSPVPQLQDSASSSHIFPVEPSSSSQRHCKSIQIYPSSHSGSHPGSSVSSSSSSENKEYRNYFDTTS